MTTRDENAGTIESSDTDPSVVTTGGPVRPMRLLGTGLVAFPALATLLIGWISLRGSGDSSAAVLPVVATAPDFSLIERSGSAVVRDDLRGKVWIADFIFTRCAGPCPELTLRMHSLQKSLGARKERVRLVSFTLDPEFDTPQVLRRYADRSHADPDTWWFLTGPDESTIHKMVQQGFLQTVVPASADNPIIHSTFFVLIDQLGRIRAFYDGLDPATKSRMLRDIDGLLSELES